MEEKQNSIYICNWGCWRLAGNDKLCSITSANRPLLILPYINGIILSNSNDYCYSRLDSDRVETTNLQINIIKFAEISVFPSLSLSRCLFSSFSPAPSTRCAAGNGCTPLLSPLLLDSNLEISRKERDANSTERRRKQWITNEQL